MTHVRLLSATVVLLVLSGCSAEASSNSGTATAAPTPTSSSPEPTDPASPLVGSWTNSLTKAEIVAAMKQAGLGRYQEKFFAHEGDVFNPKAQWIYTFDGTSFSGGYLQSDGTWRIGYKGTARVDGDTVVLHDADGGFDSTFHWSIDDGRLSFTFVSNNATNLYYGVPAKTYDIVYMTSEPFEATDCSPSNDFCA